MSRPASKNSLRRSGSPTFKRHAILVELTAESVEALLGSTRSCTLTYLCRAYLQFGADAMSSDDLAKLRAAISKRAP